MSEHPSSHDPLDGLTRIAILGGISLAVHIIGGEVPSLAQFSKFTAGFLVLLAANVVLLLVGIGVFAFWRKFRRRLDVQPRSMIGISLIGAFWATVFETILGGSAFVAGIGVILVLGVFNTWREPPGGFLIPIVLAVTGGCVAFIFCATHSIILYRDEC